MAEMVWHLLAFGLGVLVGAPFGAVVVHRRTRQPADMQERTTGISLADGEFIRAGEGHERIFVHQFSPRGFDLTMKVVSVEPVVDQLKRLPQELCPIDPADAQEAIIAERRRLDQSPEAWNERKFGVADVFTARDKDLDTPELTINLYETEYAAFQTLRVAWQTDRGRAVTRAVTADLLRDVLPGLSHSLGVNATVVTADNMVLLTHRSGKISSERKKKHISMNEGMKLADSTVHRPNPTVAIARGLLEELGIDDLHGRQPMIHSLILDVERYQWGFLAHIELFGTPWTSSRLEAMRASGNAIDNWENDGLRPVPFTPEHMLRELADPAEWVAHGWVNLLLSSIYAFPNHQKEFVDLLARAQRI